MLANYFIAIATFVAISNAENVGWKSYFVENPTEFHDIPLSWESGNQTSVPSWLSGIYVRNGPAQHTFGSEKRHLSSWLDGFAKLHSFKFDGSNVYFSGKMIQSTTYLDSVANGELVPQITLSPLANPDEEWTTLEMGDILMKQTNQIFGNGNHFAFDNTNPGLWRMASKEDPMYMAVTDVPYAQQFDIDTLDTIGLLSPAPEMKITTACTHWQREPGTDNSITFIFKGDMAGIFSDYVEVHRFTPENRDYSKPEVVATFYPHKISAVHSFAITESYAVFFNPAVTYDMSLPNMYKKNFHVLELLEYTENEFTDVFIVNLKTGEVQEIQLLAYFFQHHINAYESNNGREIIVDLSPSDPLGLKEYVKMENMINPPQFSNGSCFTTSGPSACSEITRYHFHLDTGSVETIEFPNLMEKENPSLSRYINQFDFPTINEAYRGKEYCIIYGWSAFDYSRTAMVKKNTCDATKDKVIYMENHYSSEMSFIANPEPKSEDDGVLVTLNFDGEREQSYLLILDGLTFTEIDRSYLPHNIPWSAHGMHFPEAKWTVNQ